MRIKTLGRTIIRSNGWIQTFKEKIIKPTKGFQVHFIQDGKHEMFCLKKLYNYHFKKIEYDKKKENLVFEMSDIIVKTKREIACISKNKDSFSKYHGVSSTYRTSKPFKSTIKIEDKSIHLGFFIDEEEAGLIYEKAKKYIHLYKGESKTFRNILNQVI